MEIKEMQNTIEAILFASGEAVEQEKLCEVLEVTQKDLAGLVAGLNDRLDDTPLTVLRLGGAYQISTRAQYGEIIKKALDVSRNTQLSQAAMEVLAIIAYNQPVTKSFVEQVRGVDSSGVMTNLVVKGLIEEAGRLDLPGKPISYKTTAGFLRCFGLDSLENLPPLVHGDEAELLEQAKEEADGTFIVDDELTADLLQDEE